MAQELADSETPVLADVAPNSEFSVIDSIRERWLVPRVLTPQWLKSMALLPQGLLSQLEPLAAQPELLPPARRMLLMQAVVAQQ